jgi:drug/metabolite transporter (DMT)-like permease
MTDLAEPLPGVPPARRQHPFTGYALYLAGATLFAINGTVSKSIVVSDIDPARLSQLRVTAAFVILAAVLAFINPQGFRLKRNEIVPIIAYGVLGVAMTQYLFFVALELLPVGIALLIEFTAPIIVALWFRFGMHIPTRRTVWAALAIALVGLALVAQVWQGFTLNPLGVTAAFGAAAALAIHFVLGDRQVRPPFNRDPVSLTMWGFAMASIMWAIFQPWWSFPWNYLAGSGYPLGADGPAVNLGFLAAWMIVLGTAVPFWLVVAALRHIRASQASVVGMTEPLLAILVAWVALGEVLTPLQILGGVIVLTGVLLAERSR